MSWFHGFRHRLRTLLHPGAYAQEVGEEIRFHLELDAMHEGDAGAARRRFGNRTYYAEEARRMTWLGALDVIRQDLGYAWRSTVRAPGFTVLVVITLALGIGVNTTTFAVLDELYLRPPPGVEDPGGVRRIWVEHVNPTLPDPSWMAQLISYPMYRAVAEATGDAAVVAVQTRQDTLRLGREPAGPWIRGVYASSNYFDVLGPRTALGRVYTANEDRLGVAVPVAVVSHAFWTTHLGGNVAAIGRPVTIDGAQYTVIGVLDRAFRGIDLQPVDVWLPMGGRAATVPEGGPWWESTNFFPFTAIARLGATAVEPELERRATRQVRAMHRERGRRDTLLNVHVGSIIEARGPAAPAQEVEIAKRLVGVAAIVLVIAYANVTNLLLARAVRRRREIALRLALGISRWRLVRLLTTETLLLASIAAVAALVAGWWGVRLLRALLMPGLQVPDASLSLRVVAFTAAVALLAGLAAGIVPALQASDPRLSTALKDGGHHRIGSSRSRLRGGLVVAQAALSVVLLVGAALFVRSLENVHGLRIGFDADRLVFGSVAFEPGERPPTPALAARMRELAARLESHPGIEAVARVAIQPMYGWSRRPRFYSGADSSEAFGPRAPLIHAVSPSFFRATGMRILRGTGFTGPDVEGAPAEVVVNDAAARLLWPGGDAIGECLRFVVPDSPCHPVVGVVENAHRSDVIESEAFAQLYLPLGTAVTSTRAGETLVVRADPRATVAAAAGLHSALRNEFSAAEPWVRSMTQQLEPQYRPWRLGAHLFTALGFLALTVALVGIYSTVSYGVSTRTHEFGVRIALGARIGNVLRQVIGEGLRTVAIGVAAGILLAMAAARLIASLLYGVSPSDPRVLLLVAATLLVVAALAALVPAWRAARVDPVVALRSD